MGFVGYAVLIAAFAFLHVFLTRLDVGRVITDHRPGKCESIQGIVDGSEDVELVRSLGIAFVSSGVVGAMGHNMKGRIYLVDLNEKSALPKATELKIDAGKDFDKANFHPHGLSSYLVNGAVRLFVITHTKNDYDTTILAFDYDAKTKTLHLKKTYKDKTMVKPNDLVATGPDSFIFTNDGAFINVILNVLELFFAYPGGSVVSYDGQAYYTILPSRLGPNGITYDAKKNVLFVAQFGEKAVFAYRLAKDKKSVQELSEVVVNTGVDNLDLNEDGSILAGCHPIAHKVLDMINHATDPKVLAPSQILRLVYDDAYKTAKVTEIYANDGSEVTGSTVAVLHKQHLLIGTVCRTLLHCTVTDPHTL